MHQGESLVVVNCSDEQLNRISQRWLGRSHWVNDIASKRNPLRDNFRSFVNCCLISACTGLLSSSGALKPLWVGDAVFTQRHRALLNIPNTVFSSMGVVSHSTVDSRGKNPDGSTCNSQSLKPVLPSVSSSSSCSTRENSNRASRDTAVLPRSSRRRRTEPAVPRALLSAEQIENAVAFVTLEE